jgi:hypothetical protein
MAHTVQQSVLNAAPYSTLSLDFNPVLAHKLDTVLRPVLQCTALRKKLQ